MSSRTARTFRSIFDANLSLTFDLRTGNRVKFSELFADYSGQKDQILKIIFAKQLARNQKAREGPKKADEDPTCEDDPDLFTLDNLRGSEYAFNLSRKGLAVQPHWPHVLEACAERVTIPYQQLKEVASPSGILGRIDTQATPLL